MVNKVRELWLILATLCELTCLMLHYDLPGLDLTFCTLSIEQRAQTGTPLTVLKQIRKVNCPGGYKSELRLRQHEFSGDYSFM